MADRIHRDALRSVRPSHEPNEPVGDPPPHSAVGLGGYNGVHIPLHTGTGLAQRHIGCDGKIPSTLEDREVWVEPLRFLSLTFERETATVGLQWSSKGAVPFLPLLRNLLTALLLCP